jgi:hypothetical protein
LFSTSVFSFDLKFNIFSTILSSLRSKMVRKTELSNLIILYFSPYITEIDLFFILVSSVLFPLKYIYIYIYIYICCIQIVLSFHFPVQTEASL